MKILGLETSCDETAAAMLQVTGKKIQIINNVVWSQIEIHKKYGGIVPEVAARSHLESIISVITESIEKHGRPDLIAVTYGPGLVTSLQVGLQTAKTLSYVWQAPLVGINHLEAHLFSWLLENEKDSGHMPVNLELKLTKKIFPAIGLVVSGGHTEMVLVYGMGRYQLIGRTRDDAVGEAFDKVAKLLNLGYPGGPIISHYAKQGEPTKIDFPRPMKESNDFDFSFSGLKTAVKYHLKEMVPTGDLSQQMTKDICASFQQAVIDVLLYKTMKAVKQFKARSIFIGGGVSANQSLIESLSSIAGESGINFYYPNREYTQDNAAMIALIGNFKKKSASKDNWRNLTADPNLRLV